MTSLQAAALYVGLNILLLIFLAYRVVARRGSARVSVGTGDDKQLELRVRAHGNASEYIPPMLIGLVLAAFMNFPVWSIHVLGSIFTLGRVLHVIGLTRTVMPARVMGIVFSWVPMGILAFALIYFAFV